jgi:hypothetical protein
VPGGASLRRRWIPFFIACCFLLALMESLGVSALKSRTSGPDFRSFYAAGRLVRTAPHNLYNLDAQKQVEDSFVFPAPIVLPYYHPAYEALLFAPFALFSFSTAYAAFMAFNAVLLLAILFAAPDDLARPLALENEWPGFMLILFAPVLVAFWHGQDSLLLLLLCTLMWRAIQRGEDVSAGLLLSLALFRFQFALPIALIVSARRGWRFAGGFLAGSAAIVLLCLGLVGRAGLQQWFGLIADSSLAGTQSGIVEHTLGIYPGSMPNLRGLLYVCGTSRLAPHSAFLLVAMASLIALGASIWRARRCGSHRIAVAVALLCAAVISYHMNFHDLSLVLLPLGLLAPRFPMGFTLLGVLAPDVVFFVLGQRWNFLLALLTLLLLACCFHRKSLHLSEDHRSGMLDGALSSLQDPTA